MQHFFYKENDMKRYGDGQNVSHCESLSTR